MKIVLWIIFAVLIGSYVCAPLVDPDLWWHIVVGRWIVAHREIPTVDYWTMFGVGLPWRAYSWSNEIILAYVDGQFGIIGLLTLKAILAITLSGSLIFCLGRASGDWKFGALLGALVCFGCISNFTLRPQTLAWILFCGCLYQAHLIARNGFSAIYLVRICLLVIVWANSHITAFLGIIAVLLWLWGVVSPKSLIKIAIGSTLGLFVTPYFGGELLTLFQTSSHPFTFNTISEFEPAKLLHHSTGLFVLLLAFLVAIENFSKLRKGVLVTLVVFSLMGLMVVKFMPFAFIVVGFAFTESWKRVRIRSGNRNVIEGVLRLERLVDRLPIQGLAFVLLALVIVNLHKVFSNPINFRELPVHAMDFVQKNSLQHPILNTFGDGGYVMYRLSDTSGNTAHLVSIDGRTNVTPPEVFEEYHRALYGTEGWSDYITRVNPKTIIWPNESPLIQIMLATGNWCVVFKNGDSSRGDSVLVRSDSVLDLECLS